ncbi:MAG: hypothetical protein FJY29_03870 [Betaproteobacteria bacterium]|nr:hypothetical protein [Betaproteobacteria bacterium]
MRKSYWVISFLLVLPHQIWANTSGSTNLVVEDQIATTLPPASRWGKDLLLEPRTIRPSQKTLKARIEGEKKRPEIAEPIVLRLKTTELRPLLAQLSTDATFRKINRSEKAKFQLMRNLESRIEKKEQQTGVRKEDRPTVAFLTLSHSDLNWIDLDKLSQALSYPSLDPYLPVAEIRELMADNTTTRERWMLHFGPRYNEIRLRVERWMTANQSAIQMPFSVLLPEHMRNLLGRYSPFRGRNCFATALQFADPNIIQAKNINLVREPGHSVALINHDEFSHALWLGYDELNQQQASLGLKFGDVVAIIDGTDENAYTSFKHAVVHIAGDIYLHKPSKSASSPIEFVRWRELVQTWQPLVKEFDVRFFRRRPTSRLNEQNSGIAIEKIKWNR